jgi:ferritin
MSFFVKEQVQEEASFMDLQQKLKIIGTSPEGLLALDRDLLARPMPVVQPLPVIGP